MPAVERPDADVGGRLRRAREARGMSLREIADTTKLSVAALEALEKNDISRLPGGIFSRAFVRSYAAEVGLDTEQVVRDFLLQFPHESVQAGSPLRASLDLDDPTAERRRTLVFWVVVALVILAVAAGGYLFLTRP